MRVALLHPPMIPLKPDLCGGLERVELSEVSGLRERGVEASLFAARVEGVHPHISQITDLGWQNRLLKFYYYLDFHRRARSADVYHGAYTPGLALLFPQKVVVGFHGAVVFELPQYHRWTNRYQQAHYAFCSEWLKRAFETRYEIPEEHLHTLYNGVDTDHFGYVKECIVRETQVTIGFVARWEPRKGMIDAIAVARGLAERGADFQLHLAGSALVGQDPTPANLELEGSIRKEASKVTQVRLPGAIHYDDMPEFLAGTDIGIFPSRDEPFGLVLIEMMAVGLPVVAYNSGAVPEIIEDDVSGIIVPEGDVRAMIDATEALIRDPDRRLRLGAGARRRVEQCFTWDRHVDQLLEIYEQIVKRNRDRQ